MAKRRAQKKPAYLPGPDDIAVVGVYEEGKGPKQKELGEWQPPVTETVRKAVDKYDDLYEEHGQLGTKVKSAELNALAIMEEEGVEYARLRNGEYLCVKTSKKLVHKSYEKLMKDKGSQDRNDQDVE